jgi:hypothetical protein
MARYMKESGQKEPSGLRRLLTYLAGVAVIVVVAIGLLAAWLVPRIQGGPGLGGAIIILGYVGWLPGLLIPYTWRFWSILNQMSLAATLWRAAICGLLYPVIAIVMAVLTMGTMGAIGVPGDAFLLVYVVGLLFGILLSIPLAILGVVHWSPKRPCGVDPDQSAPS